MSYEELVAWAEEESQSPYLRSPPPHKDRPLRKDFEGLVTFHRVWNYEDDFTNDVPFLTDDEVYKSPAKLAENVDVVNENTSKVPVDSHMDEVLDLGNRSPNVDVVNENTSKVPVEAEVNNDEQVDIDAVVLARQKKLDKGKGIVTEKEKGSSQKKNMIRRPTGITIRENVNPVSSDTDTDSEAFVEKTYCDSSDYDSFASGNESDKSYDYLSECEDEVIQLRKRICQRKQTLADDQEEGNDDLENDTPEVVESYISPGLTSLVREHERYMETLLKRIKGNGIGISDPFCVDLKAKDNDKYPVHDEDTHWRLKKPKVIIL